MRKLTRKQYEQHLNDIEIPRDELKSNGGRIPDKAMYGTWVRRNDPILFNVGYNDFIREMENQHDNT